MNTVTANPSWADATIGSLQNVWARLVGVLPQLLAAIVVLVIGFFLAKAVAALVTKLLGATPIDRTLERTGMPERIRKGGINFSLSKFLGSVAYWLVMVVTFTVIADTMRWATLGSFLRGIVAYMPNVLVAMAILVVGFLASRIVHDLVEGGLRASNIQGAAAETISTVARMAVIVFAAMAAMTQLGIAQDLVKILFAGVVAALALGIGLAFGLAGRDQAARLLERLGEDMSETTRKPTTRTPQARAS